MKKSEGYVELLFPDTQAAGRGESAVLEWLCQHRLPYTTFLANGTYGNGVAEAVSYFLEAVRTNR
ncbi:hypothetical protein FE784_18400 [Paenibacillus hemerocallicola]|uniref:Uncharacterized protein n=1 Tax=Paenibacillus hemerocallicola TaxID=1172614 RepID=A0A5C4T711_9BACL|nr:hypothetical protein [Paenibacillus hemerocallicola]TNJ64818.1 hypothetical protein FE784_18400 [Paenibacillus hemerocallicola]